MYKNKLGFITFKKQNKIRLMLNNNSILQILKKLTIIVLKIGNYQEKFFGYLAKIEDCTLILEDKLLQKHNQKID